MLDQRHERPVSDQSDWSLGIGGEPCARIASLRAECQFLGVNPLAVSILPVVMFPALPIGGESLDIKSGYTYREAVSAMEGYGEQGQPTYP